MSAPIYTRQQPTDSASEYNALVFQMLQFMQSGAKVIFGKVVNVTPSANAGYAGTVDVQELLLQRDPAGNILEGSNATIYKIPYLRIQAGNFAIVAEPQVGDKGICLFTDQDSSAVIAAQDIAPVATPIYNALDNGVWVGWSLNGPATQTITVSQTDGITIETPFPVTINKAVFDTQGNINTPGDVIANGISLTKHKHIDVQPGTGESGTPTMT